MASEGRILCLDVGEVRTGLALTDPMRIIASPHGFLDVRSHEEDARAIKALVDEQEVVCIVAGLPLDQNGQVGPQAQKVLDFLEVLKSVVDVEVVTQDERFSTAAARRLLIESGVSRKGRKSRIDKVAAQMILQTYLDRLANTPPTE